MEMSALDVRSSTMPVFGNFVTKISNRSFPYQIFDQAFWLPSDLPLKVTILWLQTSDLLSDGIDCSVIVVFCVRYSHVLDVKRCYTSRVLTLYSHFHTRIGQAKRGTPTM